jgi:methionine aminopeptidase
MIYLKSPEELSIIKENGDILGRCHAEVAKAIKPGVTTLELDKIAYEFISDNHAHPSFLNYQVGSKKYAYSLCISVNDVVVHGLPGNLVLKEGDTIAIDAGVVASPRLYGGVVWNAYFTSKSLTGIMEEWDRGYNHGVSHAAAAIRAIGEQP